MSEFTSQLKQILRNYTPNDVNVYEGKSARYKELVLSMAKTKERWDKFSKLFGGVIKLIPVVGGSFVGILFATKNLQMGIVLGIGYMSFYVILIMLEMFIPKDGTDYHAEIEIRQHYNNLKIMAAEVAFYSRLQKISVDDNEERIEQLSAMLHEQLTGAVQDSWTNVQTILSPNTTNRNLQLTSVRVTGIPDKIHSQLTPICEMICEACTTFFGSARYTVKIYLKTAHNINNLRIEMLTSLVKFPINHKSKNPGGGTSWIYCKGITATVWQCIVDEQDVIQRQEEKKPNNPLETYASIAYIKLPEGIGVLTIESSERTTFSPEKKISEDIKRVLMVGTNLLIKDALNEN